MGSEAVFEKEELVRRLKASSDALADDRLRWLVGREKELIEEGNVFGERLPQEEFDHVMLESIRREYEKNRILLSLGDGALTVKEMAGRVGLSTREVLKNLVVMESEGLVTVSHIEGSSPKYIKTGG